MEKGVFATLQNAVEIAIHKAADEEIKRHKEQFEKEMQTAKRNIVSRIVDTIQISAQQDLPNGEYIIQIKLNGGSDGNSIYT